MHPTHAVLFLLVSLASASTVFASPYDQEINAAAARFGLSPDLVHAVVTVESNYKKNALSHAGAKGLMQLMPATAKRFGVSNRADPVQNLRGGTQYLAWLLKRYKGDLNLALAGYNAGEGAVDKYKGIPPYRETKQYVVKVQKELNRRQESSSRATANPNTVRVTKHQASQQSGNKKDIVRVTTLQAGLSTRHKEKSTDVQPVQKKTPPKGYTVRYASLTTTQTKTSPVAFSFFGVN